MPIIDTPRAARRRSETVTCLLLAVLIAAPTAFVMRPALQVLPLGPWVVVVGVLALAIVFLVELLVRAVRR